MEEYYILREGDKEGPFTIEELSKSPLFHSTMLWKKGEEKWKPATHFEELRGIYTPDFPRRKSNNLVTILIIALVIAMLLSAIAILGFVYYKEVNKPAEEPQKTIQDYQLEKEEKEKKERLLQEKENERLEKEKKEREEKERLAIEKKKSETRLTIDSLVTIGHNEIQSESWLWGGVRSFDVTISNGTDYFIDEVLVKVDYLKNGEVRSTEFITFQNFKSGEHHTQSTRGSRSGREAKCYIHRISSEELNLNTLLRN